MRDILAQGYVPYYGSVSKIPEGTEIVIQRNEEDLNLNPFKMDPTYHTPIVKSDRAYKVNSVRNDGDKYFLKDTNTVGELVIGPFDTSTQSTLGKYSLYIPKETIINTKTVQNNPQTMYFDEVNPLDRGGGTRKQKSKKRTTRRRRVLRKKSRKSRR
jgi:hypothetical protein